MPIGIGAKGGPTELDALRSIEGMNQGRAKEALHDIQAHLSQPGRQSGVLTLHNRTSDGKEMRLERQSGLQLWLNDDEERLDDTTHALKTMLKSAGLDGAVKDLEAYLQNQGGQQNRVSARKMLEILNTHLPDEKSSSLKDLYSQSRVELGRPIGSGAFGRVNLATIDGKDCVVKEFKESPRNPLPLLSLERGADNNDATASYLMSKKPEHANYLSEKVHITQPMFYLISRERGESRDFQMVDPHTMRHIVGKNADVKCHGLVMRKADGEEVGKLVGTLDNSEKRQLIQSTLQSIKGLNERGFVHRDLKPENTFFDRKTGIATLIDTDMMFKAGKTPGKHPQAIEGDAAGTPTYMHPRAFHNEAHGTETDLYALGIMSLKVDHPRAVGYLEMAIGRENAREGSKGITPDWLRGKLDEALKQEHLSQETKDDLSALRADMNDRSTLSGFAMTCLALAGRSAEEWSDRDTAQKRYSQLLDQPYFQAR